MKRALSSLAGWLPPAVRRSAAGLTLDFGSLPGRLRDPVRRREPWQVLHNVGGGDFVRAGEETLGLMQEFAGLTPACDVLDIGCGTGRVAWPLARFLDPDARYLGFDVSRAAIRACIARLRSHRPDFVFTRVDVANREYSPGAAEPESSFVFPAADAAFDVALASSVFSHMTMPAIANYLAETRRALRPGGRFMFTAYALTEARLGDIADGRASLPFRPWRDGAMVMDPRSPERAIAHSCPRILHAIEASGLELHRPVAFGRWAAPSTYPGAQDLFVVRRSGD